MAEKKGNPQVKVTLELITNKRLLKQWGYKEPVISVSNRSMDTLVSESKNPWLFATYQRFIGLSEKFEADKDKALGGRRVCKACRGCCLVIVCGSKKPCKDGPYSEIPIG